MGSNETIVVTATPTLMNVNMTNVPKLTPTTFMMWNRQVYSLLDGYELAGYLDGSVEVPPPTLTTNGVISVNPAFTIWKRQDKLIYSSLLGVISLTVQPTVSRATTAAEVWAKLNATYAKPSRGHIKQLKLQLKQWTKGTKSVDGYIHGLTTRFDQLALLGKTIEHEDQLDLIIDGLTDEYKPVVDQMEGRDTPPSLTEFHEKLLNHEAKLLTMVAASSASPVTSNAASYRGNNNNNRNNNRHTSRSNQTGQQHQSFTPRQDYRPPRPYNGKCQICGIHGHSARRCSQLQLYGASSASAPAPPTHTYAAP
ncbi:Retrovirus-related Pol polyprotein from transposon RE1 [Cardamine amara subsp. amara]|uniref:Retrovirus-related Pol polyprotein from transposon RE1 n=1 Tax=Cardamine amara subsp. amara TaxID=228776 RepID=A0ABD1ANP0_CARAN